MNGRAHTGKASRTRASVRRSAAASPGCASLALALTWVVAALVPATHAKDAVALYDFTLLGRPHVDDLANALLHLLDPGLFILWGVLLMVARAVRRRPLLALAVALVMGWRR